MFDSVKTRWHNYMVRVEVEDQLIRQGVNPFEPFAWEARITDAIDTKKEQVATAVRNKAREQILSLINDANTNTDSPLAQMFSGIDFDGIAEQLAAQFSQQ